MNPYNAAFPAFPTSFEGRLPNQNSNDSNSGPPNAPGGQFRGRGNRGGTRGGGPWTMRPPTNANAPPPPGMMNPPQFIPGPPPGQPSFGGGTRGRGGFQEMPPQSGGGTGGGFKGRGGGRGGRGGDRGGGRGRGRGRGRGGFGGGAEANDSGEGHGSSDLSLFHPTMLSNPWKTLEAQAGLPHCFTPASHVFPPNPTPDSTNPDEVTLTIDEDNDNASTTG